MAVDDKKIETMLKRYRPVGPGPALRERIFHIGNNRPTRLRQLAIAASVLVVLGGAIWLSFSVRAKQAEPSKNKMTVEEIELAVIRAGIAEQMLAAGDLLAEQPGGQQYARERYMYVAATYPNDKVAEKAKSRLQKLSERSTKQ